jgi:hypothetical protein
LTLPSSPRCPSAASSATSCPRWDGTPLPAPAHAPEEYRESMLKNVRLHREIMEAWEEHGEG